MVVYILKSSACLAIFLLFYKLLLEQESIHRFKRYFLLGAITISFVIPTVVFTDVVYTELPASLNSYSADYSLEEFHIPIEPSIDYTYRIILLLYFIGVLFFSFKFFKNLIHLKKTIQQNPKYKINSIINVLLSSLIVPHTFFNYIFLNKQKYEANEIPIAVLIHEETHARQKHSIDILVMEILQIAFWFNPLIYLFKKSIKLNHEFLADSAVLNQGLEKSDYQNILLAFSSNATEPQLANAINYSSIKKRFTVMKKRTSKKSILLRSFLILPIVTLLLLGFSERKLVEEQKVNSIVDEMVFQPENIEIRIDNEGRLFVEEQEVSNLQELKELLLNFTQDLSKEQREQKVNAVIKVETDTPKKIIEQVDRILMEYGVAQLNILGPGPAYTGNLIETVTEQSQTDKYNSLAKKYNNIPIENRIIPLKDLKVLESIYKQMTDEQKKEVLPFPECLPKNKQEEILIIAEVIEVKVDRNGKIFFKDKLVDLKKFKKALTKINADLSKDEKNQVVRSIIYADKNAPKMLITEINTILTTYGSAIIDVVGLEYSYPLNPQDGATRNQMAIYNVLAKKYNEMKKGSMKILKQDVTQLKYIHSLMSDKQKADAEPFPNFPEPPPTPNSPKTPKTANTPNFTNKQINGYIEGQGSNNHIGKPTEPTSEISNRDIVAVDSSNTLMINGKIHYLIREAGTTKIYNRSGERVNKKGQVIDPSEKTIEIIEVIEVPSPPEPPEPISPLDHALEMEKQDAVFYFGRKKITSEDAIKMLRENKDLSMDIDKKENQPPVVKIRKYE